MKSVKLIYVAFVILMIACFAYIYHPYKVKKIIPSEELQQSYKNAPMDSVIIQTIEKNTSHQKKISPAPQQHASQGTAPPPPPEAYCNRTGGPCAVSGMNYGCCSGYTCQPGGETCIPKT